MFLTNLKTALRNLKKNKLFAFINIAGLAIGLTVYLFGTLLVRYENTHDLFFENALQTYTVGSLAAEGLNVGVDFLDATFSAVGPIVNAELSDVQATARTVYREFLVSAGEDSYYQGIRFTDADLLRIFDFEFIHGDDSALEDASGIVLSEESAIKFFGSTDVLGEVLTFDNEYDYRVSAVIADVPRNSHFNSQYVIENPLAVFMSFKGLARMRDFDEAGDWSDLSLGNLTYVLLPDGLDGAWLQARMDEIFERHVPEEINEVIAGFRVLPLQRANLAVWDTFGVPVVGVISLLSTLVLIVACVNYTNLATAQSLGRTREVGMRKTMGARKGQLLMQFLIESVVIVSIAMLVAVAALELVIPLFNNLTNKALALHYLSTLPWLIVTTVVVGVLAGAYPAWLITRISPIDALRDVARKGRKGSFMRSLMIGTQFAISAFMLALVTIVFAQNDRVRESGEIYPQTQVYTLDRVGVDGIVERLETLRNELEALPDVEAVSWSSQVPFEQSNSTSDYSAVPGEEAGKISANRLRITPEFFAVYDIPVLAGRNFSRAVGNDQVREGGEAVNVIVNELMLEQLGLGSAQEAINKRIYPLSDNEEYREMIVVGVVPSQNILGLFNSIKPWVFLYDPARLRIGSVRINGNYVRAVDDIERTWKRVVPDFPVQGRYLDDVFDDVYNILKYMNSALAGFATVALSLAMIGLFGLAAFMAAQRTKEIGIRKVLGANSLQITRLLVWQFSKPVLWALMIGLPLAYLASESYLNFFADRIGPPIAILLLSGLIAVGMAWITVAGHAFRVSRSNPILALRYE